MKMNVHTTATALVIAAALAMTPAVLAETGNETPTTAEAAAARISDNGDAGLADTLETTETVRTNTGGRTLQDPPARRAGVSWAGIQPGRVSTARPQATMENPAVHDETYVAFGWDYGSQTGSSTHGVGGQMDMPMGSSPVRVFTGGSLHQNDGATRVYVGGGPGVRYRMNDSVDVVAAVLFGWRYENRGQKNKFQPRFGGGVGLPLPRDNRPPPDGRVRQGDPPRRRRSARASRSRQPATRQKTAPRDPG